MVVIINNIVEMALSSSLKSIFFLFLIHFTVFIKLADVSHAQTNVSGVIKSVNNESLPNIHIDISSMSDSDIFSQPKAVWSAEESRYEIVFDKPGLYRIQVYGVFHKSASIPIFIYEQGSLAMDIYLLPVAYNSGEHFDKQAYTNWIRAYGNFNDYDFFSGVIFSKDENGAITANIKPDADTLRYQVRGISSGSRVLPGADEYRFRENRTFEGIFYTANMDSVVLRYHPDEKLSFQKAVPEVLQSPHFSLRAFLSFKDPKDFLWIEPLIMVRSMQTTISHLHSSGQPKPDSSEVVKKIAQSFQRWPETFSTQKAKKRIRAALELKDLHHQQRSALCIAYAGLLQQQSRLSNFFQEFSEDQKDTNDVSGDESDMIQKIIQFAEPGHPLWALNPKAPLHILHLSGYQEDVVKYAEQIIKNHPNDLVVRYLALDLIERYADQYENIRQMPLYEWIISRYGKNHLARKAIIAFRETRKE